MPLGALGGCFLIMLLWSYLAPGPRAASEIGRGDARLIQKDFEKARIYYQRAQELTPRDFRVYQRLGRAYQGLGRSEKAREMFHQALDLSPDDLDTRALLSESLLRSGEGAAAERVIRATLAANPACLESLIQLGWARELQGDVDASERWYQKAAEIHPHYFEAEYQLGQIDLNAERYEEALAHYHYTFGIASGWDVLALEGSVLALLKLERPQQVEARLEDLKSKGGHPAGSLAKAHFNLGIFYAIKGDVVRARSHLNNTLLYVETGQVAERAREVLGKLAQ